MVKYLAITLQRRALQLAVQLQARHLVLHHVPIGLELEVMQSCAQGYHMASLHGTIYFIMAPYIGISRDTYNIW